MTFLAQVIKARHLKKMSQQELADQIGVAKSTIARIDSGTTSPNLDTIIKIAEALDVKFIIGGSSGISDDRMMIEL